MARRFLTPSARASLARIALFAFTLRALIPAGFMPSAERPFTLEFCPDGFPVELLPGSSHDHALHGTPVAYPHPHPTRDDGSGHDGDTRQSGHCAFAAPAGAPQLADASAVTIPVETGKLTGFEYLAPSFGPHRFLLSQPRAPPTLA
jgi:hypothetical protein